MEEQLEQPPAKNPPTDNRQEQPESGQGNDANLANSPVQMDKVLGTSTMDLATSRHPLPLELNCEIFKCLKLAIQRKFIWGLGRDIYGMFGQKLLKKTKRLCNPKGNRWEGSKGCGKVIFSRDGLDANANNNTNRWANVWAEKGFSISGPNCREDDFPGTVLFYFEVKMLTPTDFWLLVGLTDVAAISDIRWIGDFANSYATTGYYEYQLANGDYQYFEFPQGAIWPEIKGYDVYGCGLVLDPNNKLAIFFTLNGQLLGRRIPICPSVDRLFPAITIWDDVHSIEANFGDDKDKPFLYDIKNCPGMDLPCF